MFAGIARRLAIVLGVLLLAVSPSAAAAEKVLTPLQFRDLMVARLQAADPPMTVTVLAIDELQVTGPGDIDMKMYLGNGYRQYLASPEDLEIITGRLVRLAASTGGEQTPLPVADLRLLIRPDTFLAEARRLQRESGKPFSEMNLPYSRPVAGDVMALLARDHPESYSYPPRADIEEVLAVEAAWTRALTNTRAALGEITVEPIGQGVSVVSTANGLAPSLMLLDNVWSGPDLSGKGDPIILLVSRAVFLLGHEGDEASIDGLVTLLEKEEASPASDLVSSNLFIRRAGRWEVFDPRAPRRVPREARLDTAA